MKVLIIPRVENFDTAEKKFSNIEFHKSYFNNISFKFVTNEVKVRYKDIDCKDFDLVWVSSYWGTRDLAYALHLYLNKHKVKHTETEKLGSKVVDHMFFALNGIPSPNTFFINSKRISKFVEEIEDVCGYPLIIKDIRGCRGKNSFLVNNREELYQAQKDFKPGTKYMYQRCIPNDYDWGVLVSNGKVAATEKSFPQKGEFRNNACNGAKEIFVDTNECPTEIKNIAIEAAKVLGLSWSRSDIVVDKNTGKPYLLEINRYPGITKGTDEVIAVIDYVSSLIKKNNEQE
ncbi:hypothetical protein JW887_03380 [Candidatus Dojkabacteria bacterium]|nr:hypothetical protein [Candidatus Dojkabacteria bacterium]